MRARRVRNQHRGDEHRSRGRTVSRAAGSQPTHVTVQNQLKDWWGGPGIPVTLRVSDTENDSWDGDSRPDHAPPQGLQGLEQAAMSPPVTSRLEVNTVERPLAPRFTLTPVINVDCELIELIPVFLRIGEFWEVEIDDRWCSPGAEDADVYQYSQKTPRGLLQYEYAVNCRSYSD